MALTKEDWILLVLKQAPLDRIHIMKDLFLIWHRSGRKITDFFKFEPYLYGPCSFEVYSELETLQADGHVVQATHPIPKWVNYSLTEKGIMAASDAEKRATSKSLGFIKTVVQETSKMSFYELLQKVYTEAPDFAVNSMFRGVIK